jgi:hypothetical protein
MDLSSLLIEFIIIFRTAFSGFELIPELPVIKKSSGYYWQFFGARSAWRLFFDGLPIIQFSLKK